MRFFKRIISRYAFFIFAKAWTQEENEEILSLINPKKGGSLVDLGCGDGRLTELFAQKAKATRVVGVEPGRIKRFINKKKVKVVTSNLNQPLPFKDNTFDIVISHFSIEHLYNVDVFIKESMRILKKNGYTIVATDNLASWPNVFALVMGWQPFSTTYGVATRALGNPFAVGGDFVVEEGDSLGELSHNKVLSYKMLLDAYKEYGFKNIEIHGVGYFPFFGTLSKFFCRIDKVHPHLLLLKASKK